MGLRRRGDHRLARDERDSRPQRPRSARVPGDGIAELGLSGDRVALLFKRFLAVEVMQVDELRALDWPAVAGDGRTTVLASNARSRYGGNARAWRPDLHLVLWNPFQGLDL